MVLNRFRYKIQGIIDGPVNFFTRHKISPNVLSFTGFLLSFLAAVMFAFDFLHIFWLGWMVPATMLTSGFFDVFDGAVARKTGKESKFGGVLDSTLDRYSDAILFVGMVLGGYIPEWLGLLAMVSSIMVSYIRSRAEVEGVNMKGVGFMERAERYFTIMGCAWVEVYVWGLTSGLYGVPGWVYFPFFEISMLFLTLLMNVTVFQRFVHAYSWLKKHEQKVPEPLPATPETSDPEYSSPEDRPGDSNPEIPD